MSLGLFVQGCLAFMAGNYIMERIKERSRSLYDIVGVIALIIVIAGIIQEHM